jgi:hypothetical protein
MLMGVKCFLVEDSGFHRIHLRRFVNRDQGKCSGPDGYHHAMSEEVARAPHHIGKERRLDGSLEAFPKGDVRWPRHCPCGYEFQDGDEWQVFTISIWKDAAGKEYTLRDNVPGMMWDAHWNHDYKPWCGPDGKSLHVVCPDGHSWCIDSRASNCTMKDDDIHKCWVRHGEPPNLTVDKNGHTCAAGAGSIQTPNWHGFLRNGELVT